MDIYDNTNVLDEVESLFDNLESTESNKHEDFSKISLGETPRNIFSHIKDQNIKNKAEKKNEGMSPIQEIKDQNSLSYIKTVSCGNIKNIEDWDEEEEIETLHEMLFPEACYPWTDHAYENMSNLNITNISQNIDDEREWLFEGFPISSCPTNFHTYSSISGTFAKKEDKQTIEQNVDPSKKPFVCIECYCAFPDSYHLKLHLKRHRGEKPFLCDQCPYMSCDKLELKRHMQRMHLRDKLCLCDQCGKCFTALVSLKEHMKSVHYREDKFYCDKCNYKTYSNLRLKYHKNQAHRVQRYSHLCPVCGFKTTGRQNFLNHVKTHTKHKSYSCEQCGKHFILKNRLSNHIKTVHQTRQFRCEVCYKLFQSKFHLERHETIHSKSKPFPCPFCLYASNTHGNLSKHVRSIHHKQDFSIKKYKNPQFIDQITVDCTEKGNNITQKYLKDLSKQLETDITVKSLQEERLLHEMAREVEILKSKNITKRLQPVDHSYSEKLNSSTGSNEAVLLKICPVVSTETEMVFSLPCEKDSKVTVSKKDFKRSLQAHCKTVHEVLNCDTSGSTKNKTDQMLSGQEFVFLDAPSLCTSTVK